MRTKVYDEIVALRKRRTAYSIVVSLNPGLFDIVTNKIILRDNGNVILRKNTSTHTKNMNRKQQKILI